MNEKNHTFIVDTILRFLAVPEPGAKVAEAIEEPMTAEEMHAAALRKLACCFPGMEDEESPANALHDSTRRQ